ncbi:hypothetical protein PISMIDRAFT_6509 [Pisolithus microcarpus 441]|uniref:Uncharacterized protein n=1 Tax=Pisolithus microcarpus 441 TaxID=765257 RepID=A0A0C9ZK73_9AGAM|nr:hypothetical protein PISMIDRAFT_6509 [Pisolithus microcarpus 441]
MWSPLTESSSNEGPPRVPFRVEDKCAPQFDERKRKYLELRSTTMVIIAIEPITFCLRE